MECPKENSMLKVEKHKEELKKESVERDANFKLSSHEVKKIIRWDLIRRKKM